MKLYRLTEAAGLIGVSRSCLRSWTKDGLIPVLRSKGNRNFWSDNMISDIKNQMRRDGDNANVKQKSITFPVGQ